MENSNRSSYIPMIDFWKFVFSVVIMCYHATSLPVFGNVVFFDNGYIFVEFFFMVSGFFMAKNLYAVKVLPIKSLGNETWRFTLKKAGGIYIPYVVAFGMHFVIRMLIEEASIKKWLVEASLSVRELTFTYSSGINFGRYHNGPTWYISAMILGVFILYPILRKYYDVFSKVIAPFFALFAYAFLQRQYKSTNLSNHFGNIMCVGFLRGVCALCIGIFLFQVVRKAKKANIKLNIVGKSAMVISEFFVVIYLMLIAYNFQNKFYPNKYDYFSIFLQAVLVFILFYDPVKINNKLYVRVYRCLGELSLYVFLNHRIWIRVFDLTTIDDTWRIREVLVAYFLLTGVSVVVCWVISFILKRYVVGKLFALVKKIFTKEQPVISE